MSLRRASRVIGAVALILLAIGLYEALWSSPRDVAMGSRIRIMYVHVGAAWVAYLSYAVTALGAILFLVRRTRRWDQIAAASAEWGVVLTTVTLVSGSLWARSVNGWWWRWGDPRLNLTLVLWFVYAGYLILRQSLEGEARASVSAALAIAGIPAAILNHLATTLFRTHHPTPILGRPDRAAADPAFLEALGWSLAAYSALYLWFLLERIRLERLRDRATLARVGRA